MNKEKFVEIIEKLDKAQKNVDFIQREGYIRLEDENPYWHLVDMVIELLSLFFKDGSDLIFWFCWEKDFGRNSRLGGITIDEVEYSCDTAEDLYDILKW